MSLAYQLVLILKFLSAMGFAAGAVGTFLTRDPKIRRLAAHRIASPCLLLTWTTGYSLVLLSGLSLWELWLSGALVLSIVASAALALAAAHPRHDKGAALLSFLSFTGIIALMVLKPTWKVMVP
jgi:hypothetical protein